MVERSTAAILQDRLTEHGLIRALGRQNVSSELIELIRERPIEDAARAVQRHIRPKLIKETGRYKMDVWAVWETGDDSPGPRPKFVPKARKTKIIAKKTVKKSAARKAAVVPVSPNYWRRVKKEMHVLLCTNDRKYAALRKQLGRQGNSQAAIVTSIAAAIGAYMGIAAAIIGPFVTLGLMALLQIGTNAWCAGQTA